MFQAKELKVTLNQSEADEIIDQIEENIDSEFGVSWETVKYWIQDFVERRDSNR